MGQVICAVLSTIQVARNIIDCIVVISMMCGTQSAGGLGGGGVSPCTPGRDGTAHACTPACHRVRLTHSLTHH
eukprot:SAG31_NODE_2337_length_5921_cov_4.269323_5_plen_73_part_00